VRGNYSLGSRQAGCLVHTPMIELTSRHPDWVIGFQDETWWNCFTQPRLRAWSPDGRPLRLVEQVSAKTDRTPKALACYGLLLRHCPVQAAQWQAVFFTTAFYTPASQRHKPRA
jgi:hypothetical protein